MILYVCLIFNLLNLFRQGKVMNKLTPEIIFEKFVSRLRSKFEDVSNIIYAKSGYEKWLQFEMYLSLKEYVTPIAYNQSRQPVQYDDGGYIADIGMEYQIKNKDNEVFRPDLWIAEVPFLYKRIDKDWVVSNEGEEELRKEFDIKNRFYHYIELKSELVKWDDNITIKKLAEDLDKIRDNKISKVNYKPRTYMAISLVTFDIPKKNDYDDLKLYEMVSKLEIYSPKNNKCQWIKDSWQFAHIGKRTFLVGAHKYI